MRKRNPLYIPCPYEVGDVLTTKNEKLPSERWPGTTWTQVKDRVILAAGDTYSVGQTGGAASVTSGGSSAANTGGTALTVSQIAAHAHLIATDGGSMTYFAPWSMQISYGAITSVGEGIYRDSAATGLAGGAEPHTHTMEHTHSVNTMPPYTVYFVWERTG